MAPRHHLRRAVLRRERVHREDEAQADGVTRAGDAVERVVGVERLRRLGRQDVDRLRRRQQVVRLEERIAQRQHQRMLDQRGEDRGASHQRVDALRAVALEVVAAVELGVEIGRERARHLVEIVVRDDVGEDDEARLADRRHRRGDVRRHGFRFRGR
jgi:hypothetical protein